MQDYTYVVYSNPVAGREDEYNDWYTNRHLADVVAVQGFVSAQRFRIVDSTAGVSPPQRYMALYTMRTDDPDGLLLRLQQLVESGAMEMSEAFSQDGLVTLLYQPISGIVAAHPGAGGRD